MSSNTPSTNTSSSPSVLPPLPDHPLIYGNILDLIGDTPLLDLDLPGNTGAKIWGKLENINPGGSTKDRICHAMLLEAAERGLLKPGGTVVEPTSGNTGIGLALVCARLGYKCVLTMPQSMSLERRALLSSMGAELVLTPSEQQMQGAIEKAEELARERGAFIPHQFDNSINPDVHSRTTAQEVLHAMGKLQLAAFVAGIGTGGTITGVGRTLKQLAPDCRVIGVEAESCATISRGEVGPTKIQGWGAGFVPDNFDSKVVDEVLTVTDQEAYNAQKLLATQGILVGISSGGAVVGARRVAEKLSPEEHVVVVLPDTGERYFSLDEYFK